MDFSFNQTMKTRKSYLKTCLQAITVASTIIFSASCNKDDKYCIASRGSGGNRVIITPVFNGKALSADDDFTDTVYVKYGTTTFPGTNVAKYDDKLISIEDRSYVDIRKLSCGVFYFWVVTRDSITGNRLTGGASFITDQTNGTFNISVPVKAQ